MGQDLIPIEFKRLPKHQPRWPHSPGALLLVDAQAGAIQQAIANQHAYLERKANEVAVLQRRMEGMDGSITASWRCCAMPCAMQGSATRCSPTRTVMASATRPPAAICRTEQGAWPRPDHRTATSLSEDATADSPCSPTRTPARTAISRWGDLGARRNQSQADRSAAAAWSPAAVPELPPHRG